MDRLPADPADTRGAVAVDPVPRPADLPQLLDVQVQEVTRGGPLVAARGPGRIEPAQAMEPEPALLADNCGERELELARDAGRAVALAPPWLDLPATDPS